LLAMIAFNICVLNWPDGGAVDFGAESFRLEADDASLSVGAVCEHCDIHARRRRYQNVNCVHLRPLGLPDAKRRWALRT
jgi:hypothetical protein